MLSKSIFEDYNMIDLRRKRVMGNSSDSGRACSIRDSSVQLGPVPHT